MGSQLYFYDAERLYIFFSDVSTSLNKALEVSKHCPSYLPKTFRATSVSPATDTIITVDDENPNEMYLYTNRFSGTKVTQNSFYKWKLDTDSHIQSTKTFDNHLYLITKRPTKDVNGNVTNLSSFVTK